MLSSWASPATWLAIFMALLIVVEANPFPISMEASKILYLVVSEEVNGEGTPGYYRANGGISNIRLGEAELLAETRRLQNIRVHDHENAVPPPRDADMEALMDITVSFLIEDRDAALRQAWQVIDPRRGNPARRAWIFELRTSPNILMRPPPNGYLALGGLHWSQITRFSEMSLSTPGISEHQGALTDEDATVPRYVTSAQLSWMPNPEFDMAWEGFGATIVPNGIFNNPGRVQLARDLMRRVTSAELISDANNRGVLRRLLDWDTDRERERNFPLLRRAQPLRLDALSLIQFNWSHVSIPIPPSAQMALLAGVASASQCWDVARRLRFYQDPRNPPPVGKRANEEEEACKGLLGVLEEIEANRSIPKGCRKIKNIELNIGLSNKLLAGTWDTVGGTLEGPAGKAEFTFAEAPDAGTRRTIRINMKSFKSEEIDIGGIDKMTINAAGEFWTLNNIKNDEFTIQDISIQAECADPNFQAHDNRYIGINRAYRHPGKDSIFDWLGRYETKTVGTLNLSPSDWSFTPPCLAIKNLEYHFKVGDSSFGGTYDKVYFALGEGKRVDLATGLDKNDHKEGTIDLKAVFNKNTVDIRDLKKLTIGDELAGPALLNGDEWNFRGIWFSATCADIPKKVEMRKFELVNQIVKHKDNNEPVWTGNMIPQNWLEVM